MLSDQKIRELVANNKLLEPFNEKQLQTTSYCILSGKVAIVYQSLNEIVNLNNKKQIELISHKIEIANGYHIKPGEYILVKTKEKLSMPENMTAHLRSWRTLIKLGLIMYDQHIDPNFNGYLYIGLYNATRNIIDIYPNLIIAQIVFEEVTGKISNEKLHNLKFHW